MFVSVGIAVMTALLSLASETDAWDGLLPETPESLSTVREGWIESYRDRLEKSLYAFTLAYELDPTDEELCRQEIYRLWVAEAQHYSDSFAELARIRAQMDPDEDGEADPEGQEAYRKAFFGWRDKAPLAQNNLVASLENVLSPGDYSVQRQRLIELMDLFQQRVFFATEDRIRLSSAGRQVRSLRRACTAKLSETGRPMPHRLWIAEQRATGESESLPSQSRVARRRLVQSQAECRPGGDAVRRIAISPDSDWLHGDGDDFGLGAISACHPVLSEWTGLVAEASRTKAAGLERGARLAALKDDFQQRLDTYVASRMGEYSQVEESTKWDEYRRLHKPLDAPLAAMTEELRLRLGWLDTTQP